jgi:hypothetical protein
MTKAEMRAELAALMIERDGKFYRPDGSGIPFKRFEPRKRSSASFLRAPSRAYQFEVLHSDWDDSRSLDGRTRMKIFSSDRPAADGGFHILPCSTAAA